MIVTKTIYILVANFSSLLKRILISLDGIATDVVKSNLNNTVWEGIRKVRYEIQNFLLCIKKFFCLLSKSFSKKNF